MRLSNRIRMLNRISGHLAQAVEDLQASICRHAPRPAQSSNTEWINHTGGAGIHHDEFTLSIIMDIEATIFNNHHITT